MLSYIIFRYPVLFQAIVRYFMIHTILSYFVQSNAHSLYMIFFIHIPILGEQVNRSFTNILKLIRNMFYKYDKSNC